jgi:hypothetical protein
VRALLPKFAVAGLAGGLALGSGLLVAVAMDAAGRSAGSGADADRLASGVAAAVDEVLATAPPSDEQVPSGDPGTSEVGEHGAEVSGAARDRSLHGCDHGRAVSEVASSKAQEHRAGHGHGAKPCPEPGGGTGTAAGRGGAPGGPPPGTPGAARAPGGDGEPAGDEPDGGADGSGDGAGEDLARPPDEAEHDDDRAGDDEGGDGAGQDADDDRRPATSVDAGRAPGRAHGRG